LPTLNSIDFTDTLRAPGATPPSDPMLIGKYLFSSRDQQGNFFPTLISFLKFDPTEMKTPPASPSSAMAAMPANGSTDENPNNVDRIAPVPRLVNYINNHLDELRSHYHVPILSAAPTWLTGSTDSRPVGCPLTPPIPVPTNRSCPSSPGLWPITLPDLPAELQRLTGDGVNVMILDTLPG
jgi:hypothetical protein